MEKWRALSAQNRAEMWRRKDDAQREARRKAREESCERRYKEFCEKRHKEKLERELSPPRHGTKVNVWKQKERWSDYDTGARSSNEAPTWPGTKRSLTTPTSPGGIAKAAKYQWTNERENMKTQRVEMYPKLFIYFAGELHFVQRKY